MNLSNMTITVPLHLRYQKPSHEQKFVTENIPLPQIFVRCQENSWKKVCVDAKQTQVEVVIPTGQLQDEELVTIVTLVATILGSLIVVFFVYQSTDANSSVNKKK